MKILSKLYKNYHKRIKLVKKGKKYCNNLNKYHIKNWIDIIEESLSKSNISNCFDIAKNTNFLYSPHFLFNTPTYYLDLVDINSHSHIDTPLIFPTNKDFHHDERIALENTAAEIVSNINTYNQSNNIDFINFSIDRCFYCHLPSKISIVIHLSDLEGILNDVPNS